MNTIRLKVEKDNESVKSDIKMIVTNTNMINRYVLLLQNRI